MDCSAMNEKKWWWISFTVAFFFAGLVAIRWYIEDHGYEPNECQVIDEDMTQRVWSHYLKEAGYPEDEKLQKVSSGVFIQSLEFEDANDVNIAGYIWQRYDRMEFGEPPGIVFPEAVDSANAIIPGKHNQPYRKIIDNQEVVGWYFEVMLRQTFNYRKFPLDHKTVNIRMWPGEFMQRIPLVPDFDSYTATGPHDKFGIDEEDMVLGNWQIEETFFDYRRQDYDASFGILDKETRKKKFPELKFNIVLKRNFMNEFIIYLIPLLTVAALLFLILLAATTEKEKAERFDFSIIGVIGVNSALFFVVIIAHIQLRREFLGSGLVYLEYFYLVMYLVILAVTLDAYLLSVGCQTKLLRYRDHLIPKLIYWPFLFGSGAIITWLSLWLLDVETQAQCPYLQ